MKPKIAHIVYQTHWDNEWYFTDRESQVQLTYHMRELLHMLENNIVDHFLLDGQTAIIEDYLSVCPEDRTRIENLIKNQQLFIGPWHTQVETFAVSGEAMINNLRLGIEYANGLGGSSMVSYLPDSFGHPVDFPQIFNGVGITKFSFRRGMGDKHALPTEFYWKGHNNSKVLTNVMIDGYGWSYAPFFSGNLLSKKLTSECTTNNLTPLELVAAKSPFNEFLLPLGNDQTPIRADFKEQLREYNERSSEYHFEETTFEKYFERLEEACGSFLPSYQGEFLDTQYSRVHKSINSVRYDVKQLHDKIERLMTHNLQPLMVIADKVGIPWEQGLVDEIWRLLSRSQTHSVCTCTDETNARIFERLKMSYELAESTQAYLMRKLALSAEITEGRTPLVVSNTSMESKTVTARYRVFTSRENFSLWFDDKEVPYSVITQEKSYGGVWHADESLHDDDKYFYLTELEIKKTMPGFSYRVFEVDSETDALHRTLPKNFDATTIENEAYVIEFINGQLNLNDKNQGKEFTNFICFENDGDAGDNYDHCPPENDWTIELDLKDSRVTSVAHKHSQTLTLSGEWSIPKNLKARENKQANSILPFSIDLKITDHDDLIELGISVDNSSLNHRLRMIVNSKIASKFSRAGTQFTEVERETQPEELNYWKEKGFVEEPTTTDPLLNYVSLIGDSYYTTVFSHGCKEYQVTGEEYDSLAITLFRACGHFGLPDLSRRPGRASGLKEIIIETPDSQLQKNLTFNLALHMGETYKADLIRKRYVRFATSDAYYHEQSLSCTGEFNISFFHTNPLSFKVPNEFSLFQLEGSQAVFSTLAKSSGKSDGYLLRVCNPGDSIVEVGTLASQHVEVKGSTNLLGNDVIKHEMTLAPGQMQTYLIQ